ncbi:MAG: ABC transporter permease [Bacillota bacterium]
MQAFLALYRATAREFLRDRMALFITLLLPLLMAVFLGMIFAEDPGFSLSLGVVVEDAGPAGEEFASLLRHPDVQSVVNIEWGSEEEMRSAVRQGRLAAALVLPADLSSQLAAGQPSALPIYYDPGQKETSGPALLVIRQMIQEINLARLEIQPLLALEERPVSSQGIPMAHQYIASMMALAVLWLGIFGTAPPLVQMREGQILRRMAVTPLKRSTLMTAQISWRFTTGILSALLLIVYGTVVYDISPVDNRGLLLLAAYALGIFVFVSLGFLLAGLARSAEGVVAMAQMVMFPMMFLSGILFPLEMLPASLRSVAAVIPLTYLGDALGQTLLGAPPLYPLWVCFAALAGWLAVLAVLAVRFFRWE